MRRTADSTDRFILQVFFNGYHGDCAKTFAVGQLDERGWNLIETAKYCLEAGIAVCRWVTQSIKKGSG